MNSMQSRPEGNGTRGNEPEEFSLFLAKKPFAILISLQYML